MALREIIARFGFDLDQTGLKKAEKGINGVVSKLRGLGVALSAGVVARGIKNFVVGMVDAGDALGKTATQLGLTSDQLQSWQAAAGFAGVEGQKFAQSMRVLQKNTLLAEQGSKQAGDAFKKLGVDIKDSNGQLKTGDQLMREVGVALNNTENSTERVALAQQLMGRTGAALLPLFKDGEKGLNKALAALERFGGGLSKDMVKAAEDAQDRFAELNIATTSFKSQIAVAILPAISQLTLALAKLLAWLSKTVAGTEAIKSAVIAFALVLGKLAIAKFGASLIALGKAAAIPLLKFVLLALVIDDLIALFTGRASVIGTFIDKIFGKGTASALVASVKKLGSAFRNLLASGDLQAFDKALEDIFGPPGAAIFSALAKLSSTIKSDFKSIFAQQAKDFKNFRANWDADVAAFKQSFGEIAKGFSSLVTKAVKFGKDLVAGMVEGIKAAPGAVYDALKGVVDSAIDKIKSKFKIGSPSRVFADEIGAPLIQGIALGAEMAKGPAQKSTQNVVSAVAAPRGGLAGGGIAPGGVVFKSNISIQVSGSAPNEQGVAQLRQGVRAELQDNRRATLEALQQLVEVPA